MSSRIDARNPRILLLVLSLPLVSLAPLAAQIEDPYLEDIASAEKRFLMGDYSKARYWYESILEAFEEEEGEDRPGAEPMLRARVGLLRLALVRGGYDEVQAGYGKLSEKERADPHAALVHCRALFRTGKYEAAVKTLRAMVGAKKGGYEARYRLGMNLAAIGTVADGKRVFEEAIAAADRESVRDALDLCYLARCHMELGGRDHMQNASALLAEASRTDRNRPEPRIAYAELVFAAYRESQGRPTAESYLKKVLENNGEVEGALLTMYRSRSFNMFLEGGKTADFLSRALALNPNSVPALVERAKRLIDDRLFEAGVEVLESALKVNPRDRAALSHRATVAHLLHDEAAETSYRKRAMAGRPGYAELDRIFGDHLVALYRFKDSVPYFEAALKLEPNFVPAMHGLAKASVYLGRGDEAVKLLTKAKDLEKGFADSWRKNILLSEKLLAEEYDVIQSDHFLVVMHKADRAVLEGYLLKWYEDAYEYLGRKYGYKPENKVRVEVLHGWVDFSVRTIGFRGFSALGACFGEFVTMVSPSDQVLRRNDFMWSATAWHEYTHVLTLALSKHRVPRWLTEGMSVYEESAKNPAWERGMLRDLLDAYHNKDLPPLRLLNRLFRGSNILFGYYQGGLVVEYLAEHHGFPKVVSMLKAFGEDQPTEQIMRDTFGITSREFDKRFLEWVRTKKLRGLRLIPRYSEKTMGRLAGHIATKPDDIESRVALGWAHLQRGKPIEAGIQLGAVLRGDPKHAMGNLLHAELLRQRGELKKAMAAYEVGFAGGADAFGSRFQFARLLSAAGRQDEALAQFQAAKACWPQCTDQALSPQLHIAAILRKQGKLTEAMMEVKSFCNTTARAFKPRLELAEYEKSLGNRQAQAAYLEECIQIDPFMRKLHDDLGEAYLALQKFSDARMEFKVALAVPEDLDRSLLDAPPQQGGDAADASDASEARAVLCVKIARCAWKLDDKDEAFAYLDRAESESPKGNAVDDVHELRARWKK